MRSLKTKGKRRLKRFTTAEWWRWRYRRDVLRSRLARMRPGKQEKRSLLRQVYCI